MPRQIVDRLRHNAANVLTVCRIIASFFYLVLALRQDWPISFLIFVAAAGTDLVDGAIARFFHQRTRLGAFLDPAADKLLMFFGFLSLTLAGALPPWLFWLVVGRDLMITGGILFFKLRRVRLVYRPTLLSKTTTLAQILLLSTTLAQVSQFFHRTPPLYGILIVGFLTAATTLQYFVIGLRILKGQSREFNAS